jgi:tetratricopeptide (TPR) repeat protein
MIRRSLLGALLTAGLLLLCPVDAQQEGAAQRLLGEAQRLEREGKVDEARTEYELLLQRFPEGPEAEIAQLALAEAYWRAGDGDRARSLLEGLEGKADSPRAAAAWVLRGRFLVEEATTRAELAEARTPFRRVPVLFDSAEYQQLGARAEAHVRSGEVSLLLGEPDLAAVDFLEAIEDEGASAWLPRALYGFARSLLAQGDRVAGADALQRVLLQPEAEESLRRDAATDLSYLDRHWIRPTLGRPRWETARAVSGIELRKPQKLAVSRDGRVLIWDDGVSQVLVLSADHQVESRSPQTQVRDVWWSADGRPFATVADAVVALDDGARQAIAVGGTALRDLGAGATGLLDEQYVVDRDRKTLISSNRKGETQTLSTSAGDVVDLAVGPRGELLVLDRRKTEIARLGLPGAPAAAATGTWRRPQSLAVDSAGNLFVLDGAENTIEMRDAGSGERGSVVGPVLPGGIELRSPEDIAIDGAGRLYVIDSRLAQLVVLE